MHDCDETAPRSRVGRANDGGETREWEVFRREAIDEPLVHVGSVTAADPETGHERAAALFGDAAGLWLCPADAVARFEVATLEGES
jgi:rSAM-partnered protein